MTDTAAKRRPPARKAKPLADGHASPDHKGAMVASAALGLAVGLAANIARKLAVQAPTALAGDWDQALAAEHGLVLKLFDALAATTERNAARRTMLLASLKHLLAKHDMAEANVIYPALREAGDAAAADHLTSDHGYIKQALFELTELPRASPAWLPRVLAFRAEIERHMHEEETALFPALKARLTPERNRYLTTQMNKEGLKIA